MAKWSGKTRGGVAGYKAFGFLIKHTNMYLVYFILCFVAFYFLLFSDKEAIRAYFTKVLGYSRFKSIGNIYRNYYMLGQVLIDKMAFLSGAHNRYSFVHEGEEHLHEMAKNKTGGMLLGAHMGNWEVAGQLLDRVGVKVNVVMLDAEHKKIKEYIGEVQGEKELNIIPIKEDQSHLNKIREALERNEFVAMHGDRFLPGMSTATVEFMGKPAKFPTGPLYLASKFKVPVSFVFTLKDSPSKYHFYATKGKIYEYPSRIKTRKADMKAMVEEYAAQLEKILKKYPCQWFNYYHFWENY